jgi:hypothetical protein
MVQGTRQTQWRTPAQDDDRRAGKLLVALWKYVTAGVVVEGAVMKAVS